jgi:hypothetical protein
MLKRLALTASIVATVALALFSTTAAAGGGGRSEEKVRGALCVAAGVEFLVENNLLVAAAKRQIDYDTIDSDSGGSEGPINTDLPPRSFLPLWKVIQLHFTNPELFDWCAA